MNTSAQETADFPDDDHDKVIKPSSSSWLRLKDPRIVRVSRAFGGKDRHSKVRTVRGLRDRLGLNQPSKVVDWLLNAAKDDVDELPPLQMPPSSFGSRNLEPDPRASVWSPETSSHVPNYTSNYNLSLSNSGSTNHGLEVGHHNMTLPVSMLTLSSSGSQPSYNFPAATNSSQLNQFQMLMMMSSGSSSQNLLPYSIGQSMRPFHFSVSASQQLGRSQNDSEGEQNEDQEQFQER